MHTTSQERADIGELASRLTADADDHAAQVAFAIESILDEVAQLMRELETLRTAVDEQRVLLDEVRVLQGKDDERCGPQTRFPEQGSGV